VQLSYDLVVKGRTSFYIVYSSTWNAAVTPVPPEPPVDECLACFLAAGITGEVEDAFLANIGLEEVCDALLAGELSLGNVVSAAAQAGVTGTTLAAFVQCIQDILGIGN
jgi:hypothetical protein